MQSTMKQAGDGPIDDAELARRSVIGFGEVVAALGRGYTGPEAEVRWPNALGARIGVAADNPWFDAAVVPVGELPPADDILLPGCLWTLADAVPGRLEEPSIATPCMGVMLDDPALLALGNGAQTVDTPSLRLLGDLNERAYGETGGFTPLVSALQDERIRAYGLKDNGSFVCVALTLTVGDDLSIHYVATEADYRRRGLASQLVLSLLAKARGEGLKTATLQASEEGLPVWERLGFRQVATLRGYLRPA
ncbi:GNAT family N-acetyltransferase [Fibrella aquatilis]|uniref:GNAT family N-acetyltransferase n=1 Tax=Fibrella aquatilis TaxID=2817059 RepID=A0A939G942_9BACT|nr:GNAT family N-acetyltransferase [Fibrella aquatilis]MBO0932346.1 GNAT family N-acetyltransferase [Fibrella aquatilis]